MLLTCWAHLDLPSWPLPQATIRLRLCGKHPPTGLHHQLTCSLQLCLYTCIWKYNLSLKDFVKVVSRNQTDPREQQVYPECWERTNPTALTQTKYT